MSQTEPKAIEIPFWHSKTLDQMSEKEWESLCDGCGRCCLNKLIDDNDQVHTTAVACKLLDLETGQCRDYVHRRAQVHDCIQFTPETLNEHYAWLPDSCAYRLLAEGYELPEWHPLVTGDPGSTRKAGFSVCGMAVSELEWPDPEEWHELIIQEE
ncbi:YcgN family cysteine cluster protein [Sansalvadorimonas sp. 2012CJ34-2]|uniref:UPF0260 protein M3P05_05315 n=1 Tax=Parendozoicomonas callyspongiae TaxID=2942213 RepID=A0ABT0PDB1_9GAMM|nr:YcgN family cysteine cluster protein [Sansalvadorimonas sp. 2012CJ34-2]MCL6269364.1 YcgN family cysteine cluster protein [Sansalvadorimonas sp. 2012CJ34-2]